MRSPSESRAPFWSGWAAVWPLGTTSTGARARMTWAVPAAWASAGAAGPRSAAPAATASATHLEALFSGPLRE